MLYRVTGNFQQKISTHTSKCKGYPNCNKGAYNRSMETNLVKKTQQ